ncbi:unnamed protein product [Caenorhabditis brenneri]
MGKTVDPLQKRYRNNSRVDPSSLQHFLCYYCGKMHGDRLEYQLHMLKVHEVMSQSYQLWSDHTMDSLGLRWSETKGHDDREASCSLPASPIPREIKTRNSDDDEDYVYEEDKPKRRKKDDEKSKKAATEKQRKRTETQKPSAEVAAERLRKAEEKRQEKLMKDEEKKRFSEENKAVQQHVKKEKRRMSTVEPLTVSGSDGVKEETTRRKRRKTEGCAGSRRREMIEEGGEETDVAALVTKILVESKKKEASSLDVEEEELTSENKDRRPFDYSFRATKYCKICKKGTHYTFASLFEHYQDHHHAVFKSFHYYGYLGRKLIGKKNLLERDYCQRCVIKFARPRDYFSHMIHFHVNESVRCQVDFEQADSADVEARMLFRDRIITLGYNFKFKEEDNYTTQYNDRPGTSASNAFDTDESLGDQTLDVGGPSDNQPSTSEVLMQMIQPCAVIVKEEVQIKPEPLDDVQF